MLGQNFQHLADYLIVVFQDPNKDEDIIQINYYNSFCYEILEDVIYYSLKYSKAIYYDKKHY